MKTLLITLTLCLGVISGTFAQNKKGLQTDSIKVEGVCGECKERIENAAYIPGVKHAEWNMDTHILTVTFKPSKTTLKDIETNIAQAGHDAGDVKAADAAYNKLPKCCAYKDEEAASQH